jgi:pimeloyl-ACP methyl ester carboxylesterase
MGSARGMAHRWIDVGGLHLHCVEAGTGPLVMLLHGFPEFWYAWRHQIPALVDAGYRVVAPDLPGYNTSDKPPRVRDYRPSVLATEVADLIVALDAGSAAVAGHDWGGGLAWLLAMHHPELVERLVAARDFRALRRALGRQPSRPGAFTAQDIDRYVAAAAQPGALRAAVNYYRAAVRTNPLAHVQTLRRVDTPTLIIWGTRTATWAGSWPRRTGPGSRTCGSSGSLRPATGCRPTPPSGSTSSWWNSCSPSAANGQEAFPPVAARRMIWAAAMVAPGRVQRPPLPRGLFATAVTRAVLQVLQSSIRVGKR